MSTLLLCRQAQSVSLMPLHVAAKVVTIVRIRGLVDSFIYCETKETQHEVFRKN